MPRARRRTWPAAAARGTPRAYRQRARGCELDASRSCDRGRRAAVADGPWKLTQLSRVTVRCWLRTRSPSGRLGQECVDTGSLIRDESAGQRFRAGFTVEDRLAVDDDPVDALRRYDASPVTVRKVVPNGVAVALVADRVVVVDVKIGCVALDEGSAPVESDDPGGELTHPEMHLLEGEKPFLSHHPRDHLGRVMSPGEELDVGAAVRSAGQDPLVAKDLGVHLRDPG